MIDHELTDPAGGALTITHDHQGVWITTTEARDEVTVGPFPPRTLRASFDMGDDLMDGGVTAAAIEAEVITPGRARSLVQERDLAKDRAATLTTQLHDALDEQVTLTRERDHLRTVLDTTARQRDEADKRAATASPRTLTDGQAERVREWAAGRYPSGTPLDQDRRMVAAETEAFLSGRPGRDLYDLIEAARHAGPVDPPTARNARGGEQV